MGSTENPSIDLFYMFSTTVFDDNNNYSLSANPSTNSFLEKENRIPQRSENSDANIFSNRDIGEEYDINIIENPNLQNMSNIHQRGVEVGSGYGTTSNIAIDAANHGDEPAEIIVSRVVFALLISISLVLNLLLILAVIRRKAMVHVIYLMSTFMILPDLLFYAKVITELVDWSADAKAVPSWATSDTACGLWQFASHAYPIFYAAFLLAIVFHAFVTLFLDYSGGYEERIKRYLVIMFLAICVTITLIVAPSGFYGKAKVEENIVGVNTNHVRSQKSYAHFRQYCDLEIPTLLPLQLESKDAINTKDELETVLKSFVASESSAIYRLVYELVLPYLLPLILLGFPYVTLMIGLMKNAPAASHSEHSTKITVVVTLWLITSYLMLNVPSVLRNVFSVLNIWHRLMSLFDAHDDVRVPRFQMYIHVVAYVCTCVWSIVRAGLCFKYNRKLRKALGP